MTVLQPLRDRLDELARCQKLLIASDYDGVIAPIVEDPAEALPNRESIHALASLTGQRDTHVALISGRARSVLGELTGLGDSVHLVGSHGSEFGPDFEGGLTDAQVELRNEVMRQLSAIAAQDPGMEIEAKPASVALHYRRAAPAVRHAVDAAVAAGPARLDGVQVKRGKMVVELTVTNATKGTAIEQLRRHLLPDAVVFLGDDVTDEDAFAVLSTADLGIKVGPGSTLATARVDNTDDVAAVLASIAEGRRTWLVGSSGARR